MTPAHPIDPATRIGHVHLKVADLERALSFYRDVLGFEVTQLMGTEAVFLSPPAATTTTSASIPGPGRLTDAC